MPALDLTPFGFTPTESLAYGALVEHGPMGGYALAKALSIARANAYQALHGLDTKRAVRRTPGSPRRYRAVDPHALFAAVVDREARKLDALEQALQQTPAPPGSSVLEVRGARSLESLMLRTAARSQSPLECLAPGELLERLAPAWHKRHADGTETRLWTVGEGNPRLPIEPVGRVAPSTAAPLGHDGSILVADPVAIVAAMDGGDASGYWTDHPVLFGLTQLAIRALTA